VPPPSIVAKIVLKVQRVPRGSVLELNTSLQSHHLLLVAPLPSSVSTWMVLGRATKAGEKKIVTNPGVG
jgi:hypothetical protein